MITIAVHDAVIRLLLEVPALVERYDRRSSEFVPGVKAWLKRAEQVLTDGGLPEAAELAALRGLLITVERGGKPPELAMPASASLGRVKAASAAEILRGAEAVLSRVTTTSTPRIAEAERMLNQIVPRAEWKGLVRPRPSDIDERLWLKHIWGAVSADDELGQALVHVVGLVGERDALTLLERMLPESTPA